MTNKLNSEKSKRESLEEIVGQEGLELGSDKEGGLKTVSINPRRKSVYAGMWGPVEIAVVSLASVVLGVVVLSYMLFVIPPQRELSSGQFQRDGLDSELRAARAKWGDIQSTETQVTKLLASADDFETRILRERSVGMSSIYQRLNVLINGYGLRNTSGPDYVPLVAGDKEKASGKEGSAKRGRDKFKSMFPGVYITLTIDGSYPNLRKFIRDIETSNEFVAITSLELEPSDEAADNTETQAFDVRDENGQLTTQRVRSGRYRGNTVSLRIEMAAYFRRSADERLNTASLTETKDKEPVISGSSD